jgi:hypothetical protein
MNSSLSLLPPSPSPRIKIHASRAGTTTTRSRTLSARRWPGRAPTKARSQYRTAERNVHACADAVQSRAAHGQSTALPASVRVAPIRPLLVVQAGTASESRPPPRAHTRLHSPPQRKEPVDPSNDGLTRLPGGRVDRPHACAGCCCCNRGLKRCWPIWPLRLCLPRSAGARQHAGMHGHRRAGTPHACARQGQAGKGPVCRSRSRRARAPARTPCARGGGSMRPVHHPIPSLNDADRAP